MEDCLFCKIIKGDIPSKTIYEDDIVKVFMDINPNTNGHLLVIPKKHYKDILEVDNDTLIYMKDIITNKIYPLLKDKLDIKGLTLSQNNGIVQEVKHLHIHVIPAYNLEDVKINVNKDSLDDIDNIYNKLKEYN